MKNLLRFHYLSVVKIACKCRVHDDHGHVHILLHSIYSYYKVIIIFIYKRKHNKETESCEKNLNGLKILPKKKSKPTKTLLCVL